MSASVGAWCSSMAPGPTDGAGPKIIGPLAADGPRSGGGAAAADLVPGRCGGARSNARARAGTGRSRGHAYAGAVIAATRSDKVKALVYVAALAPDKGETVADVFYRGEPHPLAPKLAPDDHGLSTCPTRPSPPPLRRTLPQKNSRCWRRCSGRFRPPASPSPSRALLEGPAGLVPGGRRTA